MIKLTYWELVTSQCVVDSHLFPMFLQRCNTHHQHIAGVSAPSPGERDLSSYVSPESGPGVRKGQRRGFIQHVHHSQQSPQPWPPAPLYPSKLPHRTGSFSCANLRRLWLQEPLLWQLPGLQTGPFHSERGDGGDEGQAERERLRKPDRR